ncbi:MAG: C4-dicarboxylate ABC transporter [Oleiphilus sp.]|nr:MAG: C4-dicarboxylate ABC transporter [Oleiphilus sp.]
MNGTDSVAVDKDSRLSAPKRFAQRGLTICILSLLLGTIISGTSENIHAQLLKLGAYLWDDYFVLRAEEPQATCNPTPDIDARIEELREEQAAENEEFDLLADEFDEDAARESLLSQVLVCQKKHADAAIYHDNMTDAVMLFRSIEHTFADISLFAIEHQKSTLILLLMMAAIVATARNNHIAFRSEHSRLDHYVSQTAQFVAYAGLGLSTYAFYRGSYASGTEVTHPELMIILMTGSAILAAINAYHWFHPSPKLTAKGNILRSLLTIPIQTFMLLAAVFHFFVRETHFPGVAIYFTQIFQLTNLHLAIGLYILGGMLLKETHLGARLFDIFKPWHLPPEMLAFVAIALLAFPTAYTGASGIIIIAMGAVVYQEMRRVGTRRQLSLAVTAMTGSGVVLRPCLLVVGIAILNKEVVTDELFFWGFRVFLVSMVVFAIFALITQKDPMKLTPASEALKPSLQRLGPMMPYVLILAGTLVVYAYLLDTYLDEFSAPIVLPVLIAIIVLYERKFSKNFRERNLELKSSATVTKAFGNAVDNSAIQIGALLMLMACSFTVGGIIERGGGVLEIPEAFSSVYAAMAFLVLFLVFIGMIMDPFGALILVTGTIAPVAYAQGIHPIHFWMTCLMAFELGYLSPPVSLNHLLTRQVVGDEEVELALKEGDNFYYRHERLLLPLMVMGTTLIVVAFGGFWVFAPHQV